MLPTGAPPPSTAVSPDVPPYLTGGSFTLLRHERTTIPKLYKKAAFNSVKFCQDVSTAAENALGYAPHPWQLDACEASFLGLVSVMIAGTGFQVYDITKLNLWSMSKA